MAEPRVALITLGCARNEVDSEELAGRLAASGFSLVADADDADAVLVNTCGFVEAAKRESVETLLDAAGLGRDGRPRAVVAVGCLAERYGVDLARELPEADAVLGFDDYPDIAGRLRSVLSGDHLEAHVPRDRRTLLPLAPAERPGTHVHVPGHAAPAAAAGRPDGGSGGATRGAPWIRRRLSGGPVSSLKIASGCDRRCAFCAIPSFRGSFVSRPPEEVLAEARWLAGQGVRELVLVSENSTSYGKDLGAPGALEALVDGLSEVDGILRVRVSYLQPAEVRPGLVRAMVRGATIADYFDLSFQHASPGLLRRMRRFGGAEAFLDLIGTIRSQAPRAGVRSNVIVGFPGETAQDLDMLMEFLSEARLDAVGVFGYSDEDGTEAAGLDAHLPEGEIRRRVGEVASLVDELMDQRAESRVGEPVEVLVESVEVDVVEGRAAHQGPEDGSTRVRLAAHAAVGGAVAGGAVAVGDMVTARVVASDGVDLIAEEARHVRA